MSLREISKTFYDKEQMWKLMILLNVCLKNISILFEIFMFDLLCSDDVFGSCFHWKFMERWDCDQCLPHTLRRVGR